MNVFDRRGQKVGHQVNVRASPDRIKIKGFVSVGAGDEVLKKLSVLVHENRVEIWFADGYVSIPFDEYWKMTEFVETGVEPKDA